MATIAKKCSICGKMYPAYNYIDIPVSREDEEDPIYEDDDGNLINYEADDSGVLIDYRPNAFEFVTIKEDMDIQYDFDNNDLCPECMTIFENFVTGKIPSATGNPVVLEDAAPGTPIEMVVDIQPSQDLHGYDHPWVGGAGKNIYPIAIGRDQFANNLGATHTTDNDTLTVTFTTTEASCGVYSRSTSSVRSVFASLSGTYTCSFDAKVNVASARVFIGVEGNGARAFDLTNSWQRFSITAEFSNTASSFVVYNNGQSSGVVADIRNLQIEQGSTATSYAPYENICPITGYDEVNATRTGKNLIDPQILTSANGNTYIMTVGYTTTGKISVKPNTTYTISIGTPTTSSADARVYGFNAEGTRSLLANSFSQSTTFTTGADTVSLSFYCKVAVFERIVDAEPMLELGTTATSYEPYQSQTVTVELNGTVYGGTLNMGTGELVVTYGVVDLGTLRLAFDSTNNVFQTSSALVKTGSEGTPIICDRYVARPYGYNGSYSTEDKIIYVHAGSGTLRVRDSAYSDATSFKNAVNGVQLVYELIEPITYNLTPAQIRLLKGSNTIETDAGALTIKYKKAIEGKMEVES